MSFDITHKQLDEYLLQLPEAWLDYPFGEGVAVYKYSRDHEGKGKMFALITEGSQPVQVSLKCDPVLAKSLRAQYETVVPGYHLNKKHWNTIICSGQLSFEEVTDLARHSFELVKSG